jgi:hypothetical protein
VKSITNKIYSGKGRDNEMDFPIKQFSNLFHIGTLDSSQKKSESFEGAGLSVTTVPDAWRRITPLPGWKYSLAKAEAKFLDMHKMKKAHKDEIKSWGVNNGYIAYEDVYRVSWYDDEMEMTLCSDYRSREKADEEADGEKPVRKRKDIVSTEKMNQRVMYREATASLALDLLATIYSEDVLGFDGVWWQDKLDVSRYSAPRGTIFADKLASWRISAV